MEIVLSGYLCKDSLPALCFLEVILVGFDEKLQQRQICRVGSGALQCFMRAILI